MPLIHSSSDPAFRSNVKTLMGEIGRSPHVKNRAQALAIAYAEKRRAKRAWGGPLGNMPWVVRQEARSLAHTGPIASAVPGRTDNHAIHVPSSSYVLPADHVSSLGQGNTAAGMKILGRMFPGSSRISGGMGAPRPPRPVLSDRGGARGEGGGDVPILAAGGEFVISPAEVAKVGNGDVKRGHEILDAWVKANRKKHIKTLSKLPGPAKS
jgi:hypothetical protein